VTTRLHVTTQLHAGVTLARALRRSTYPSVIKQLMNVSVVTYCCICMSD
jgi:hypothetical protein